MAERFEAIYSDAQRDAAASAFEDRRIRPASRVVELAKAGELRHDGEQLAPFDLTENTVRDLARKLRRRRAGEQSSVLAKQPPRDAVETLRQRLVNLADAMLAAEEKKGAKADPQRIREIARAAREIAAIPDRTDPTPPKPGAKQPGTGARQGSETRGGKIGALLAAHRTEGRDAHDETPAPNGAHQTTSAHAHHDAPDDTQRFNATQNDKQNGRPGGSAREQAAELGLA